MGTLDSRRTGTCRPQGVTLKNFSLSQPFRLLSPDKRLLWFKIISHPALFPPLLFILDVALFSTETRSHISSSGDFFKVCWDGWRSSGGYKVQKLVSLTWKQKKCRLITVPCWAQAAIFTGFRFQTHINHLWGEKKKLEMPLPVSSCVGYQFFRVPPLYCYCIHNPHNDIQRFTVWNARLSRPQFPDCGATWLFPRAGANRNCCIFDKLHQSSKIAFKNQATQWAPAGCIQGGWFWGNQWRQRR